MADTVVVVEPRIHTVEIAGAPSVAVVVEESVQVVTVGIQGPEGAAGVSAADALLKLNRLSEFDTQAAKVEARGNLELETIDLGTFN